jgi:hypothetical protein
MPPEPSFRYTTYDPIRSPSTTAVDDLADDLVDDDDEVR